MNHLRNSLGSVLSQPGVQLLCSVVLCAALLCVSGLRLRHILPLFWDARVYLHAIRTDLAGGNPYQRAGELNFVSPPVFLHAARLLAKVIPLRLLGVVYLALHCAAFVFIPWVLRRWYLPSSCLTLPLALAVFFCHPYLTTEVAFISANMSTLLYAAILAAGIPGLGRNRWGWFCVAVAGASLIKAQFLAFLLLPVLAGETQFLACVLTGVAVLLGTALEKYLWPAAYRDYLDAVWYQLMVRGDMGVGLTQYLHHVHLRIVPPLLRDQAGLIVHCAVMVPVCLALIWWRFRRGVRPPRRLFVPAALVMAVLLNPRLQDYDADLAILPAVFLLVEEFGAPAWRSANPFSVALWTSALALFFAKSANLALIAVLLGSVALFLWQTRADAEPRAQARPPDAYVPERAARPLPSWQSHRPNRSFGGGVPRQGER